MSRLGRLAPLLLILLVVAVQFAPVLLGRVYRFEDIGGYFEPLWTAAARAMRAGRWPLWDGGAWSGQAIAGDPQAGAFYPVHWLWCVVPVLRVYALDVAAHALLAGVGMYALVRARGGSRAGAALGGVALAVGGYVVLQTRHVMFVEATAWLPWVVAAGWRYLETRGRGWLALAAAGTGMLLLTGGVSMIYYGAWFAAAVLLPRALATRRPWTGRWRGVVGLGIAALLGAGLAAPSIVPAILHGRLSPRALGADEGFAASVAWSGLKYLPTLFVPNLLGQEVRGDYLGGGTQWELCGYYTGMVTVALGLYALYRGPAERRGERIALALLMLACVLLAPGARSPLHHLACLLLPFYSAMRCPPRALYVVALAMPMLAADGLDLLLARLAPRPTLQRTLRVALPMLVALDLLVTHRAENPSTTLAAAHDAAFPDAADFLHAHLRPGDRYLNDVHLPHDLHDSGLLWDLPNAGGYSSLPLWRYLHYQWIANHGAPYPHDRLADDLSAQGLWRFDSPLLDALGVRWVLAPKDWQPHAGGYVKRFEGARIDAWENTEAQPRAWLVERAHRVGSEHEAARLLPGIDPRREAIVEGPGEITTAGRGTVTVTRVEERGLVELHVALDGPGLCVIAEPFHPGWRVSIDGHGQAGDGQPGRVVAADYALVGVPLPAGEHVVRLEMAWSAVQWGLWIGGAALLGVIGLALSGARRRRG